MITEIGIAAGEIWKLLDENGRLELSAVFQKVSGGKDLALMALGWLSREGHVIITQGDDGVHAELAGWRGAEK